MSTVPTTISGQIEFYEARVQVWAANAAALGLTAAEAEELEISTAESRESLLLKTAADQAAKGRTLELQADMRTLRQRGSGAIAKIRARAKSLSPSEAAALYALAQLPPPAAPSPVPAPGSPTDFRITLEQSGVLQLTWKCPKPRGSVGTVYEVRRRTTATGPFASVGATGVRKFVDDTIPAGASSVTYEVTAIRSTVRGTPAYFTVGFGTASNGQLTATLVEAPRLAA